MGTLGGLGFRSSADPVSAVEPSLPSLVNPGDPRMRLAPADPSSLVPSRPAPFHAALAVAALLLSGAASTTAHAQDGPAFGDSGWVAPAPIGAIDGAPTDPGPRVAGRDTDPVGETVLRTPFRVAFLPLRVVGMGLEKLAGVVGEGLVAPRRFAHQRPRFTVGPTFSYSGSSGPAIGVRATTLLDPAHEARASLGGTWSLRDARRVRADLRWGVPEDAFGAFARAGYDFRPNRRFYGIGNGSSEDDKSIFLAEVGRADVALRFGPLDREVRLLGGWSSTSIRRGWNDSPGVLDRFALAEVPGMLDETKVLSFGLGGDLALLDDRRDPSAGVHARAEGRQNQALSGGEFDFRSWHLEARAYVPVFSKRRVIAVRALHQGVDPSDDATAPIPFYLLPESADDARFAAYAAHRFMDRHLALGHVEYRWLIWDRLWALGLAPVGEVASSASGLRIADVHESYGGGLRFAFTPTSVARLSVAKGTEGIAAYVTFKEDF